MTHRNMDLAELRKNIDEVDSKLIELLNQRMNLVHQVGEYKKQHQLPPLDANRWRAVLESRLNQAEELGLNPNLVKTIYNAIHDAALKLEARV